MLSLVVACVHACILCACMHARDVCLWAECTECEFSDSRMTYVHIYVLAICVFVHILHIDDIYTYMSYHTNVASVYVYI